MTDMGEFSEALQDCRPLDLKPPEAVKVVSKRDLNLSDNVIRHIIVGIAINNILVPYLKLYVNETLEAFFDELKMRFMIDTDNNTLVSPKAEGFAFQYDLMPKTSKKARRAKKGHQSEPEVSPPPKIESHHELAKLYLFMKSSKDFKEVTEDNVDATAIFTILGKASCFSKEERNFANEVRAKVRNAWAHCNYKDWSLEQYNDCFTVFENLASCVRAEFQGKEELKKKILTCKYDGMRLLGKYFESDLLERLFTDLQVVIRKEQSNQDGGVEYPNLVKELKKSSRCLGQSINAINEKLSGIHDDIKDIKVSIENNHARPTGTGRLSGSTFSGYLPTKNECFSGRERELRRMAEVLQQENTQALLAISGLGGTGKTSLVVHVCHLVKPYFPGGIYWVTADSGSDGTIDIKESLQDKFRECCQLRRGMADSELISVITSHLVGLGEKFLIVVDNFDTDEMSDLSYRLINGPWFVNCNRNASMIVTSRLKEEHLNELLRKTPKPEVIPLTEFTLEEGSDFLRKRTSMAMEDRDCQELVNSLGGLPLALDQAAAFLNVSTYTLSEYIAKIKQDKQRLPMLDQKNAHQVTENTHRNRRAVQTTWKVNMEAIKDELEAAERVAHVLAFMSPRNIPKVALDLSCFTKSDKSDEVDVNQIILVLTKYSLFAETDKATVKVHRLVQDIIKEEVERERKTPETLQNSLSMLSIALEKVESPKGLDNLAGIDSLADWAMTMDNVGHLLENLLSRRNELILQDAALARLLDHSLLYFTIQNENQRVRSYMKHLNHILDNHQEGHEAYVPQFTVAVSKEKKEELHELMNRPSRNLSCPSHRDGLKQLEACQSLYAEAKKCMDEKKFNQAAAKFGICLTYNLLDPKDKKDALHRCMWSCKKGGDPVKAISRALEVLAIDKDDNGALFVIGECFKKLEEAAIKTKETATETSKLETLCYRELASVWMALLYKKSPTGWGRVPSVAQSKELLVHEVTTTGELVALSEEKACRKRIILLKQGSYHVMGEDLVRLFGDSSCARTSLVGDPYKGSMPTLVIKSPARIVTSFVACNLHFSMKGGRLELANHYGTKTGKNPDVVIAIKCKFDCHQSTSDSKSVLSIAGKNRVVFVDCVISDSPGAGLVVKEGMADVCLVKCQIRDCLKEGIYCEASANLHMEHCDVISNKDGVRLRISEDQVTVAMIACTVQDNLISGILAEGENSSCPRGKLEVVRCHVHHCHFGISLGNLTTVTSIKDNRIFSNNFGIWILNEQTYSTVIEGNDIYQNSFEGIFISGCQNVFLFRNRIHDHTSTGISQVAFDPVADELARPNVKKTSNPAIKLDNIEANNNVKYESPSEVKWEDSDSQTNCRHCHNKISTTISKCTRCDKAVYCSDFCLEKDWPRHMVYCDYFIKENTCTVEIELTEQSIKKTRYGHNYHWEGKGDEGCSYFLVTMTPNVLCETSSLDWRQFKKYKIGVHDWRNSITSDDTLPSSGQSKLCSIVSQFGTKLEDDCTHKSLILKGRVMKVGMAADQTSRGNVIVTIQLITDRFIFSWSEDGCHQKCIDCDPTNPEPVADGNMIPRCSGCYNQMKLDAILRRNMELCRYE